MRILQPRRLPFIFAASTVLLAQTIVIAGQVEKSGRVDFDFDGAPAANVEVDLKNGTLASMSNIATAAVEGMIDGLNESAESPAIRESTHLLNAVREIVGLTTEVVREVRVRVYEDLPDQQVHANMLAHYQEKLSNDDWDKVISVREHGEQVAVCVQQTDSAINGVFVMVAERDELVLANVVCELTPERVKELTSKATKVGMKFGLGDAIEQAMREISPHRNPRATTASADSAHRK